jgi:alpha-glucosidase (family GH31 glycosyl hydrolase)
LRVYPGADGQFSWYEDDGISFAYQQGEFGRTECSWQNSTRKLTIVRTGKNIPSRSKNVIIRSMDTEESKTISLTKQLTVIDL